MNVPLAIVTGAPGWLGSQLVQSLVSGVRDVPGVSPQGDRVVRCLVHRGTDASELRAISERVEIVEGDLTDPSSLAPLFNEARGATIFHSAGIIHPTRGVGEWTRVNVNGTKSLLEHAAASGVRRFVHVSSNSPLGVNDRHEGLFDEESPYNPYMGYGASKKLGEDLVNAAGRGGALETVIIRPPWFYGPGQPPRQALFFRMIKDGKGPLVGSGANRRSMAYVDNICQGLLLCERVPAAAGRTYWIADRRAYRMDEILDTIERVMEKDFGVVTAHKRMRLPGIASGVAWFVDRILQAMGIYHQKIHVLSEMNKTIACTIAKAEKELGYDPKVDLEEGMRRSIRWMLDRGEKL